MFLSRSGRVAAATALLVAVLGIGQARAAAEVHRMNLVISMIPSTIDGGDFNRQIDNINQTQLTPLGLEGLKRVTFGWLFDAQLQYFVRPNMAVALGVGQIRSRTDREYLPAIDQAVQLHGEVLSVPVQVGGLYYLAPYNQGDFQARAYLGGGLMSMVHNRALFQTESRNVANVPNQVVSGTQDAPGYYLELGGHMFFASRWSVMLGGVYRSAKISNLVNQDTGQPYLTFEGKPYTLDMSGIGAKLGIALGF